MKMKIKDLQFARLLVKNLDLSDDQIFQALNTEIDIISTGEPDTTVIRNNTVVVNNPSSIVKFLVEVLYRTLSAFISNPFMKDKLSLSLNLMCSDYVYNEPNNKISGPPVMVSVHKIITPFSILSEIIEPVVKKIRKFPVFYYPCNFTDTCRPINNLAELKKYYSLTNLSFLEDNFPVILCNTNIHNSAAKEAGILITTLQMNFGEDKTDKIIEELLINKTSRLPEHMYDILKLTNGDYDFMFDFVDCLSASYQNNMTSVFSNIVLKHIKTSAEKYTPSVFKQWGQWSMIMGLIEKQLTPMRGSMWPASERIKPNEDELRNFQASVAKSKGKNILNMEEQLEAYRDYWKTNAIQPGKLIEHILRDNRVWKQ